MKILSLEEFELLAEGHLADGQCFGVSDAERCSALRGLADGDWLMGIVGIYVP